MKKLQLKTGLVLSLALMAGEVSLAQENAGEPKKVEVFKFRSIEINNGDTVEQLMEFNDYSEIPDEIKKKLERTRQGVPGREPGERPVQSFENREIRKFETFRINEDESTGLTEEQKQCIKEIREKMLERRTEFNPAEGEIKMIRRGKDLKGSREEFHFPVDGNKEQKISILIIESMKDETMGKEEPGSKGPSSVERMEMGRAQVKVYPNPASNEISVEYTIEQLPASISLTDLQGKEIFREDILEKGKFLKKFSLPENAVRMYILNISEPNHKVSKKVFIKRK